MLLPIRKCSKKRLAVLTRVILWINYLQVLNRMSGAVFSTHCSGGITYFVILTRLLKFRFLFTSTTSTIGQMRLMSVEVNFEILLLSYSIWIKNYFSTKILVLACFSLFQSKFMMIGNSYIHTYIQQQCICIAPLRQDQSAK